MISSAEALTGQHIPIPGLQQGPSAGVSSFAATPVEQQIQDVIDGLTAAGVPSLETVSALSAPQRMAQSFVACKHMMMKMMLRMRSTFLSSS